MAQRGGHVLVRPTIDGQDPLGFFLLDTGVPNSPTARAEGLARNELLHIMRSVAMKDKQGPSKRMVGNGVAGSVKMLLCTYASRCKRVCDREGGGGQTGHVRVWGAVCGGHDRPHQGSLPQGQEPSAGTPHHGRTPLPVSMILCMPAHIDRLHIQLVHVSHTHFNINIATDLQMLGCLSTGFFRS